MTDFADVDNVLQAPECVSFGEPGSGTMSPGSRNVLAMSDFAGDIDAELGGPLLLSAVHLDMPDYTDVSRCRIAWISVSRGPGRSPWGPGV